MARDLTRLRLCTNIEALFIGMDFLRTTGIKPGRHKTEAAPKIASSDPRGLVPAGPVSFYKLFFPALFLAAHLLRIAIAIFLRASGENVRRPLLRGASPRFASSMASARSSLAFSIFKL